MYDRDDMLKDLKKYACEVHFKKVNGEQRSMHCSLSENLVPNGTDIKHLDEQHAKTENKDVIAVWDLQKGGWRSFRVDSVYYFNALDNYE